VVGMIPPSTGLFFHWTRLRLHSLSTRLDSPASRLDSPASRLDRFLRDWTRFLRLDFPSSTRLADFDWTRLLDFFDFNWFLPLDLLSSTGLTFVDRTQPCSIGLVFFFHWTRLLRLDWTRLLQLDPPSMTRSSIHCRLL
jgi:hypothetical protein